MIVCFLLFVLLGSSAALQESERLELRNEAEDMFFHAYNAYMQVAWPADELMPLSCKGRYRGREPGRGDIDEALGNFSLTLIDSLDMLVVLGRIDEFEDAVLKVVETVSFDSDIVVSVFETNIRIVGGLVSGHVLAEYVRDKHGRMTWYTGELLNMALDIGNRLLPAFNSTTGLPYPRVNLRTGLKGVNSIQLTCTACAGSMILEFAALSRLSGESIYEEKASQAMDYLWRARHRQSNLVGNVLNVNTGDWVRRESGVGAGIDSYYEYVAKAYVLLGEEKYLDRWKTHYSAIMKYLNTGPLMGDVHMHHPTTNSKHFTDALGAFWPGLQVLMGDLIPAIEQHEVLYQIMKKHSFLPEAITSDFQVHWGQHFLRPEFVESTYFLYKATKDPHYLDVGKKVLKALQKHARVTCGYAAVKDVRTMVLDDRMDSFVLSETFKYLYLLFSKDDELFLDMNQFVFTTEAHLLPLSLARLSNTTVVPVTDEFHDLLQTDEEVEFAQACPSTRYMFPEHTRTADAAASVRRPLGNIVEAATPRQRVIKRRILAGDFTATDPDHIALVKQMGVNLMSLPDGRVQLLHTFANAESQEDAEEGLLFMQEMIEMSKQTQQSQDSPPKQVRLSLGDKELVLQAGPAQFGPSLTKGSEVTGMLVKAGDMKACIGGLQNGESMWGNIVLVERGDCMFIEKARVLQSLGAVGGIVMDTTEGSAAGASPIFAMSGDGSQDVSIPMVFLFMEEAKQLLQALAENPSLNVRLEEKPASQQSDFGSEVEEEEVDGVKSPVHAFLKSNINVEMVGEDYVSVHTDEVTGEIVSSTVRTVQGPHGSSTKFKTIQKMKMGEIETLKSIGTAKIIKIEPSFKIEPVTQTPANIGQGSAQLIVDEEDIVPEEEEDVVLQEDEVHQENVVPHLLGSLVNTEDDLNKYQNMNLNEMDDVDEEVIDDTIEEVEEEEEGEVEEVVEGEGEMFDILEDISSFLQPGSQEIKDIIDQTIASDPQLLSQLLSISFTDLVGAAEVIMKEKKSIKETYSTIFNQVQKMGADAFIESTKQKRRESTKLEESIVDLLGDGGVVELISEYLESVPDPDKKDRIQLLSTLQLTAQELDSKLRKGRNAH